jgi:hypothetical protein
LLGSNLFVEHVQLALGFHRKSIDGVFEVGGSVGVEMAKAAAF